MNTGEQVYFPELRSGQSSLLLDGTEFHHLVRVRRFAPGDTIWLVNGLGLAANCQISKISAEAVELKILEEVSSRGEPEKAIVLAIGNLKGDHLNTVVEKAVELGATEIIPLLTRHTVKKGLNQNRLQRIAVAAMKQCRRSVLPNIHDLTPFKSCQKMNQAALHLFCHAHVEAHPILSLAPHIQSAERVVIWIGPEGDWSQDEIDLASISDYTFTGLGPRRLRAETAALHALGLVSALL